MKPLNEQIQRLRDILHTCYESIASKGGTLPPVGERNMTNLPDAVESVPQVINAELEELTITQNGEYLPSEGVAGFSKVTAEFDTSSLPKVKLASGFRVTNECVNNNGRWYGEDIIDTSECTTFENTFSGCSSLLEINANWDTKNVKTIRACFSGCTNLKKINGIDKWDVSGVSANYNCRETFMNCSNLEELHLGEWKTNSFGELNSTFKYCRKLHTLDVSGWDTSKVASFSFVFEQCNVLKELDLTSWSVERFTGGWLMQAMFNGTTLLETIVGRRTIDDVISNNITCLRNLAYTPSGLGFPIKLDRAS